MILFWSCLTLNMNIWLPLFWRTWKRDRGSDSAMGSDFSYCMLLSKGAWKDLAIVFPWIIEKKSLNCKKYWKKSGAQFRFFNSHPPACFALACHRTASASVLHCLAIDHLLKADQRLFWNSYLNSTEATTQWLTCPEYRWALACKWFRTILLFQVFTTSPEYILI